MEMVSVNSRQTAKIYEFPTGALRQPRTFTADETRVAGQFSDLAFGGSWYHDEALREAKADPSKPVN